ncbi:golgin subfamily A member 6-like protein 6 [Hippocampus comes]|uniref:golgin subfamily A member 6-like protein 6 n=1 Tax=Hippocampus comes TaxID=109280 RepID=UPI00094E8D0E|nr:PREDICTED: golgin subfamily A member 6-like protein 6 [Hippocampus comes]
MDNLESRSPSAGAREYTSTPIADCPRRTHHQRHQAMVSEGGYFKQSGLKRALFYSESSNRDLVAQNTALRAQMESERQSHHRERQRLQQALDEARSDRSAPAIEQKLREREHEMGVLQDILAAAQRETVQVRQYWMEEHNLLKRAREDDSENIVAAVNAEWQQWWSVREQEAAAQLQAQWESAQWHAEEMAAQFNAKLQSVQRHSTDTVVYYKAELERQQWHMSRSVMEKDDVIAKLTKENCLLEADQTALSGQILKLETEACELQQSVFHLREELKVEREARTLVDEELPAAIAALTREIELERQHHRKEEQMLREALDEIQLQEKRMEASDLQDALAASQRETANVRKYWMQECEELKKSAEENTKTMVEAINSEWQRFKAEWEHMQRHTSQALREKDDLLATLLADIEKLTSQLVKVKPETPEHLDAETVLGKQDDLDDLASPRQLSNKSGVIHVQ